MDRHKIKESRRHEFDIAYMRMAWAVSMLSRARRKQVGCVIVSEDDQVIAQGFNGTPSGFDNNCEDDWCDKFDKQTELCRKNCDFAKDNECTDCGYWRLKTKKIVLHAEPNAITKCAKSNHSTKGATMYVTLSPCIDCAKLIVQSEIKRLVYLEDYDKSEGVNFLEKAGVVIDKLSEVEVLTPYKN